MSRKRIGDMLVEAGLLTQDQLQDAIKQQRGSGQKLGHFLVRQGLVKESDVVDLLSRQLRFPRYTPDRYPVDPDMSFLIPLDVAKKYELAPLKREAATLYLAMTDPTDINALDAVEELTGLDGEPVICTEFQLQELQGSIYGMSVGMSGILESVEDMQFTDEPGADELDRLEAAQGGDLADLAEGAPVVRMVNWIIAEAVRLKASDIHISPEKDLVQLRFRIDGRLKEVPSPPRKMLLPIISRIKILAHMDISVSRTPQDGRFSTVIDQREINVRASTVPTINGENVVLRLLDMSSKIYTLDQLGMRAVDAARLKKLIHQPYGMILSTGPTGSGKTTSLYSLLMLLNRPDIHIMTIEDPVEYRMEHVRQIELNARAGMTFASGLRSILRQDPDVIMVGEIRDSETAAIATQSALTGHRVFSTAHTNDAAGAITRLIDMGIEPFLVTSVLLAVFAQRLLRKVCPDCCRPCELAPEVIRAWGLDAVEDARFMEAVGCAKCQQLGYRGRTGVFEMLYIDEAIHERIIKRAPMQDIKAVAREAGDLTTLREDAAKKVAQGITTLEEAAATVVV